MTHFGGAFCKVPGKWTSLESGHLCLMQDIPMTPVCLYWFLWRNVVAFVRDCVFTLVLVLCLPGVRLHSTCGDNRSQHGLCVQQSKTVCSRCFILHEGQKKRWSSLKSIPAYFSQVCGCCYQVYPRLAKMVRTNTSLVMTAIWGLAKVWHPC